MITDSLVAFWELEEASGTRADAHGSHDLTPQNAPPAAAGKVWNGVSLAHDSAQWLSAPDHADLSNFVAGWTLAAWVRPVPHASGIYLPFASKGDATGGAEFVVARYFNDANAGKVSAFACTGAEFAGLVEVVGGDLPDNELSLVIAWYDAARGQLCVQVNDGPVTYAPFTGAWDSSGTFNIGQLAGAGNYFNGLVDQVGLWRRPLSAVERAWLYNGGAGRAYGELEHARPDTGSPRTDMVRAFEQIKALVQAWHTQIGA